MMDGTISLKGLCWLRFDRAILPSARLFLSEFLTIARSKTQVASFRILQLLFVGSV